MGNKLFVYLNKTRIGVLEKNNLGKLSFYYLQDAKIALSASLPLIKDKIFVDAEILPFFEGILPEGNLRKNIATKYGLSESNVFGLLEKIGGDCAGAVSVYSEDFDMSNSKYFQQCVDEPKLVKGLKNLQKNADISLAKYSRLSLAGVNEKTTIIFQEHKFYLPDEQHPSNYIIKIDINRADIPFIIENEFFCLRLAKAAGFNVCDCDFQIYDNFGYLLIKRYDRFEDKKKIIKIHQEDFCQILGKLPNNKYEVEGGPSIKDCGSVINTFLTTPLEGKMNFIDAIIYNYCIGNSDAHGKNFSVIYHENKINLAPLYDLVCTEVYKNLAKNMAMKIGGESRPYYVCERHWQRFSEDLDINFKFLRKRILELSAKILQEALQLQKEFRIQTKIIDDIVKIVEKRVSRIQRILNN